MWKRLVFLITCSVAALANASEDDNNWLTGDTVKGKPVIAKLDLESLQPGKIHKFFFAVEDNGVGQSWYVPVMVAKGQRDGPRLLLNAALHGDELNGVAVIQRLFADLQPEHLRGSVIALPGINISGMLANSRFFQVSYNGGSTENLNRQMPGNPESRHPGERYTHRLWHKIYKGNIDAAIDIHTQFTGWSFPLFIYADYQDPKVRRIAELIQPEFIKIDKGLEGTFETTALAAGIPAITLEVGSPKQYQWDYIDHARRGIRNVMVDMGMLNGDIETLATDTVVGNQYHTVRARVGGFIETLVELKDKVSKDQPLVIQRNAFGETVAEYSAPFDGYVISLASDPLREPGAPLVRILRMSAEEGCRYGC